MPPRKAPTKRATKADASPVMVRSVTSFIAEVNGEQRIVKPGEALRADDPLVAQCPDYFEPQVS